MSAAALVEALRGRLRGRMTERADLAPLTTYKLGGPAEVLVEPEEPEDLIIVSEALASADLGPDEIPVLVLGRGSNLVVSDKGFDGLVIRLGQVFTDIEEYHQPGSEPGTGARAGGGVAMPQLANWTVRRGLAGFEWAVGVPGSVGGGVRMNAGAHGVEVADHLVSAEVWDIFATGVATRAAADLDLSYRHSNLADHEVVTAATFTFEPVDTDQIRARAEAHRAHRASTQPGALQNAGSVFKNPPGDFAGRLVEAAGLKGFSVGSATVSELHANFFLAPPGSSAQDVYDLVRAVRDRVSEGSGVTLEPEIRFVGAFEERSVTKGGR